MKKCRRHTKGNKVYITRRVNGKQTWFSLGSVGDPKEVLDARQAEIEARLIKAAVTKDFQASGFVNYSFKEAWALYAECKKPIRSEGTGIVIDIVGDNFKGYFQKMGLRQITSDNLSAYVSHRRSQLVTKEKEQHNTKYATIRKELHFFSDFQTWARDRGLITKKIDIPQFKNLIAAETEEVTPLTMPQVKQLLDNCQLPYLRDYIESSIRSGLRISDLLNLKKGNINLETCKLKMKTQKAKVIVEQNLKNGYLELVKRLYQNSQNDYLLQDEHGSPLKYNPQKIYRALKKYVKSQGLAWVSPHTLRHTCVSLLADAGFQISQVAKWVGHASVKTTADIYTHLFDKAKDGMAEALDFSLPTATQPEAKPDGKPVEVRNLDRNMIEQNENSLYLQ